MGAKNKNMKEVIAIYKDGKFHQYLMKSEVRLLLEITKAIGEITIELIKISTSEYKIKFGK